MPMVIIMIFSSSGSGFGSEQSVHRNRLPAANLKLLTSKNESGEDGLALRAFAVVGHKPEHEDIISTGSTLAVSSHGNQGSKIYSGTYHGSR